MNADWEVVIVGRSFAGLSAALTLGRMRRAALVIGTGGPRNESVAHAHGLLTRDGANPNDLIAIAEADLAKYPSVELVDARVTSIERHDEMFRVHFDRGMSTASNVILATGVNDNPPPTPGLADHWGRGVYTCPFCDGYEHHDEPVAVVGDPDFTAHVARMLTAVTDQVTVYGDIDDNARAELRAAGIAADGRAVARVIGDGAHVTGVELADGSLHKVSAVFTAGLPSPNTELAATLGCRLDDHGFVAVDATHQTSIAGIWAAGDATTMHHQMSIAIAQGSIAGAACVARLLFGTGPVPTADDVE